MFACGRQATSRFVARMLARSFGRTLAEGVFSRLFTNQKPQVTIDTAKRSVRHVPKHPEADIMSVPWCASYPRRAGPGAGADHRTRGARYRGGRLCLLLSDCD